MTQTPDSMKMTKAHTVVNLLHNLCMILVFATIGLRVGAQVDFVEGSFEELLDSAAAQDKQVLVDAYTDWCGWCKVMDRETFSQERVGEYVNRKFVATKIDMERGFGVKLAMKYRVRSYPQYLIFSSQGHLLARLSGYMEPEPFIEAVEAALDTSRT